MTQTPKDELDMALWSVVQEELPQLGITRDKGMRLSDVTSSIARSRGLEPEKIMSGLLEGVRLGELVVDDDLVRHA
jgi:hypothetical protein